MSLLLLFGGAGPQVAFSPDFTIVDFYSRKRQGFNSCERSGFTSRKRATFISAKRN